MKGKGGKNTPKTLADLRKERRRILAELDQAQGLARRTRSQSVHASLRKRQSVRELEEDLEDIQLELEQRFRVMAKSGENTSTGSVLKAAFADLSDPGTTGAEAGITDTGNTPPENLAAINTMTGASKSPLKESSQDTQQIVETDESYKTPQAKQIPPGSLFAPLPAVRPRPYNLPQVQRMPPLSAFDWNAPVNPINETYKRVAPTNPSCTNPSSAASAYLANAQAAHNDEIKKMRQEMQQMRNMFENKIKMQEEELKALRSKHVQFKDVDTSKGAIPKGSRTQLQIPNSPYESRKFNFEPQENIIMSNEELITPKSPGLKSPASQLDAEDMEMSRSRTPDAYSETLQTLTQLIRELQVDTRQKHEILNQIFDDKVPQEEDNNLGAYQPIPQPIARPNRESTAKQTAQTIPQMDNQSNINPLAQLIAQARPQAKSMAKQISDKIQDQEKARESFLRRLRYVPEFDGESFQSLRKFLDIAKALNDTFINDAEKNELIDTLTLQLRGEAKEVVGDLYEISFEKMRDKLLQHFSYLMNKEVVTAQIESISQGEKETLTEYSERARKLLKEKCSTYKFLSEDQKKEYDRTARRAFARGIRDSHLRDRLITRGSSSLEDAIAYVIEVEADTSVMIPNSELYCKYCKTNGHRENKCFKKAANASGLTQLINMLGGVTNPGQNLKNFSNFRGRGGRGGNWRNSRGNLNSNSNENNRNDRRNNNSRNWNSNRGGNNNNWYGNNGNNASGYNNSQNRGSNRGNQGQKSWGGQKYQNSNQSTRNETQNSTVTVQSNDGQLKNTEN